MSRRQQRDSSSAHHTSDLFKEQQGVTGMLRAPGAPCNPITLVLVDVSGTCKCAGIKGPLEYPGGPLGVAGLPPDGGREGWGEGLSVSCGCDSLMNR